MDTVSKRESEDEYVCFKEFHYDNWTIRVRKPVLTEEERNRRRAELARAAAELMKEMEKIRRKKCME